MKYARLADLSVYLVGLAAIGGGVCAIDPAWAAVTVGSILLLTVFAARMGKGVAG